jgi:DNA-binding beta-propeller fold protein YncE
MDSLRPAGGFPASPGWAPAPRPGVHADQVRRREDGSGSAMSSVTQGSSQSIIGSGDFQYRVIENWAKYPAGYVDNDVAAVAVDKEDRVYLFTRGTIPVLVFDRDGNLLKTWGEGTFSRPHGLHAGPDDTIYCTDDKDHTVRKCTLDGKVLLEIGLPGHPAPAMSGEPFNRCTHTALSPRGDIYVADGYKNARVHKYAPDGKLLMSWGESGCDPGQFNIVHNICCDDDGWVYVADRENHRIQIFDGNGKFETQWHDLHRPCALYMDRGPKPKCYVAELPPTGSVNVGHPNLGAMVKIISQDGKRLARMGDPRPGPGPTQFIGPHGLAVDSHDDIYVAEVLYTQWARVMPATPKVPEGRQSIRKMVKIK